MKLSADRGKDKILIGGSPSSGSTLLSVMIDCHPDMFCGPETNIIAHHGIWDGRRPVGHFLPPPPGATGTEIADGVTWGRPNLTALGYHLVPLAELRANAKQLTDPLELLDYLLKPRMMLEKKTVGCDKSPVNIYGIMPALELNESLKAIVTVRNGPDVVRSLARRGSSPILAVTRWLAKMNLCYAAASRYGPDRVLTVRYEDLTTDPTTVAERICEFAGVEAEEAPSRMVRRQYSLRLESDASICEQQGASGAWIFSPTNKIVSIADRASPSELPNRTIGLLNQARLSARALREFGSRSEPKDSLEISSAFGYATDWDTTVSPRKPTRLNPSNNRYTDFHRQLLTGGEVDSAKEAESVPTRDTRNWLRRTFGSRW